MLYERSDQLKYCLNHGIFKASFMAPNLDNNTEPANFYERAIWQKAKEAASERTWIYVLKDTEAWKIN